jgi:hypothetical protein
MKPFHCGPSYFGEMPRVPCADRENQAEAAASQSLGFCCRNRPMRQQVPVKRQVFSSSASLDGGQTKSRRLWFPAIVTGNTLTLPVSIAKYKNLDTFYFPGIGE